MSDNNAQQQPISGDTAIDMDKIGRPSTETSQPLPHMGMGKKINHQCSPRFLFAGLRTEY
jgi:hypothetical protein